ncbi:MAG: hypothetical protein IPL46_19500 [Saprospiraceae bacterium]|nr:hypothetical protein [Saprospiraceae bacterium]MBK8504195.1 hypothetical protein [Saprospiraceae bacterium]
MKRHNATEIFPLIAAYEEGTLSKEGFCKKTRLKESSLIYWRNKYQKHMDTENGAVSPTRSKTEAFVRVNPGIVRNPDFQMEIIMPDGKRVRFSSLVPEAYLENILTIR